MATLQRLTMRYWLPLLLLALFAPFSEEMDLAASRFFYRDGTGNFSSSSFWDFFYYFGTYPALLTAGGALILYLSSFWFSSLARYKKSAAMVALTLIIGSGLIVHAILKDHWGRPRPRQTVFFGGAYPFSPFYIPHFKGIKAVKSDQGSQEAGINKEAFRSFPCGHCTMGFFFFSLMFAFRRHGRNRLAALAGWVAVILGFFLSLSRIAVGGHFLSDTLASLVIMWLTAAFLDHLFFKRHFSAGEHS